LRARDRVWSGILVGVLAAAGICGEEEAGRLPATARAREARFVHRIILRDAEGEPITPKSTAPYSPKATCSSSRCHNYEVIAAGTHSRMFPGKALAADLPPAHKWTLFEGLSGCSAPLSAGFLAPKPEAFNPKVHLGLFDIAKLFGPFHPGGGRLELDSQGNRYDQRMTADPRPPETDPDYYRAKWDQSGVLEHDCLVCHSLSGYDHVERGAQIARGNFKWAPTIGAGLGKLEGWGKDTKVVYDPKVFSPEGKVHLAIGQPPDNNCLFCHRRPAVGATVWADCLEADVHSQSGIRCADCHAGGPDHVFPGDPRARGPRFGSLTCEGCHTTGRLGATALRHEGLPRLHLDKIDCEVCHSGPRPRDIPLAVEEPTDPTWGVILSGKKPSGPMVFAGVYGRGADGKLHLFSRMLPSFFGNRATGDLVPLKPSSILSRFRRVLKELKDDDGDGSPEMNTPSEIATVLKALKRSSVVPVYLHGGMAYSLDEAGKLRSAPSPLAEPIDRPLFHNVRPAPQALGARGCLECHEDGSPFFNSIAPVKAVGQGGLPEGQPLYARMGRSPLMQELAAIREAYIKPLGPVVVAAVALLILLHYVVFGPRRYEKRLPEELVQRFNWLERLIHLGLLGSFLVLAASGLTIAAGGERVLEVDADALHEFFSWCLITSGALAFLVWVRDMVFSRVDIGWFKVLGGYLGYKGHVPAGRFNAGQKLYFWLISAVVACLALTGLMLRFGWRPDLSPLAYTLHDLCAYLMIACVLGHAYLGTFANPGTIGSVFNGKVHRAWLEHHHPDYKPRG